MILFLDYGNESAVFGAIGGKSARWLVSPLAAGDLRPLARALANFGLSRRQPQTVVVSLHDRSAGVPPVSWSTVRAAVAAANTLAFTWDVPVAAVRLTGQESREEWAAKARQAAVEAKKGVWVSARYSGEPNITQAKKWGSGGVAKLGSS